MRGGRGYYSRGSGNRRGGGSNYRSSNTYGDRVNSNNRMGGRYDNNYSGASGSNRYHSSNYDSRNRDNFNGGRRDMSNKRSYPDSSRDRSGDRKHSRSDDYRRSSLGHSNRTPPPPPPPPLGSTSDSRNYRGSNSAVNSYRGGGDRSHSSTHRHRSPPPKRPMRTGMVQSRPRGVMSSSSRGIRPSLRGTLRSHNIRRESVDLKIMRRKLFYAQQKDRQRVIKIARLTSTLRRRRLERNSKSPRRSRSDKKSSDSEEDDDQDKDKDKNGDESKDAEENEDDNEDLGEKSDADEAGDKKKSKGKTTTKRSAKSADKDDEDGAEKSKTTAKNGDNDEEESENKANKSKQDEGDSSAEAEHEKNADATEEGTSKVVSKSADANGEHDKKDGKKTEKESSRKEKDKSTPKKSSSKKDDKKRKEESSSKDDKRDKEKKSSTSRSFSRRDDHSSSMRNSSRFIKLTCVHCNMKCVTFKEYSQHLHLVRHKVAIRQVAVRQRAYLMRLRMTQRTAQREIEEKSKEEYEPKFCHICRLNYRQPKAKHQLSEHHKTIKKFLMPYCSTCHLAFKSPMLYETHRCSLEHIRNKARKNDSDSDNSGDDMREIDLNKYTTVDSVGEIDDDLGVDADMDVDGVLDEAQNDADDDGATNKLPVGAKFIKKLECFFCSLCNTYTPASGLYFRGFSKKHCLLRAHLKAFLAHKNAEESANKKNATEKQTEGEADDDGVVVKGEKDEVNEKSIAEETGNNAEADDVDISTDVLDDEELWNDVDKDLGELLAEVEHNSNADGEEDEDESVLNIDIESEKSKAKEKEMNGIKESNVAEQKKEVASTPKASPSKPKPQRKAAAAATTKLVDAGKEKVPAK